MTIACQIVCILIAVDHPDGNDQGKYRLTVILRANLDLFKYYFGLIHCYNFSMSTDKQRLSYDKVVQAVLGRAKRTKSDQVSRSELAIILSELARVLGRQVAGAVVELGCYRGATSLMMAQLMVELAPTKQLYLYDSFAGLPSKTEYDRSVLGTTFSREYLRRASQKY